jgi:hypothetical protein
VPLPADDAKACRSRDGDQSAAWRIAGAYAYERQLGDTRPMTMQVPSPPARVATVWLFVALIGGVGVVAGEVVSALWLLAVLGAIACLAGVTGLGILVYRVSRQTGTGVLRSLGRTLLAAIRLLFDLLP